MNYRELLADLAEKWIENEIHHKVSKEASNHFWRIANDKFHELYLAKGTIRRKVPQFSHLRDRLQQRKVPRVNMELGYESKDDGQVSVVKDATITPVSMFPPCSYKQLYEIASVDVSIYFFVLIAKCRTVVRKNLDRKEVPKFHNI